MGLFWLTLWLFLHSDQVYGAVNVEYRPNVLDGHITIIYGNDGTGPFSDNESQVRKVRSQSSDFKELDNVNSIDGTGKVLLNTYLYGNSFKTQRPLAGQHTTMIGRSYKDKYKQRKWFSQRPKKNCSSKISNILHATNTLNIITKLSTNIINNDNTNIEEQEINKEQVNNSMAKDATNILLRYKNLDYTNTSIEDTIYIKHGKSATLSNNDTNYINISTGEEADIENLTTTVPSYDKANLEDTALSSGEEADIENESYFNKYQLSDTTFNTSTDGDKEDETSSFDEFVKEKIPKEKSTKKVKRNVPHLALLFPMNSQAEMEADNEYTCKNKRCRERVKDYVCSCNNRYRNPGQRAYYRHPYRLYNIKDYDSNYESDSETSTETNYETTDVSFRPLMNYLRYISQRSQYSEEDTEQNTEEDDHQSLWNSSKYYKKNNLLRNKFRTRPKLRNILKTQYKNKQTKYPENKLHMKSNEGKNIFGRFDEMQEKDSGISSYKLSQSQDSEIDKLQKQLWYQSIKPSTTSFRQPHYPRKCAHSLLKYLKTYHPDYLDDVYQTSFNYYDEEQKEDETRDKNKYMGQYEHSDDKDSIQPDSAYIQDHQIVHELISKYLESRRRGDKTNLQYSPDYLPSQDVKDKPTNHSEDSRTYHPDTITEIKRPLQSQIMSKVTNQYSDWIEAEPERDDGDDVIVGQAPVQTIFERFPSDLEEREDKHLGFTEVNKYSEKRKNKSPPMNYFPESTTDILHYINDRTIIDEYPQKDITTPHKTYDTTYQTSKFDSDTFVTSKELNQNTQYTPVTEGAYDIPHHNIPSVYDTYVGHQSLKTTTVMQRLVNDYKFYGTEPILKEDSHTYLGSTLSTTDDKEYANVLTTIQSDTLKHPNEGRSDSKTPKVDNGQYILDQLINPITSNTLDQSLLKAEQNDILVGEPWLYDRHSLQDNPTFPTLNEGGLKSTMQQIWTPTATESIMPLTQSELFGTDQHKKSKHTEHFDATNFVKTYANEIQTKPTYLLNAIFTKGNPSTTIHQNHYSPNYKEYFPTIEQMSTFVDDLWATESYEHTDVKHPVKETILQIMDRDPDVQKYSSQQIERTPTGSTTTVFDKVDTIYHVIPSTTSDYAYWDVLPTISSSQDDTSNYKDYLPDSKHKFDFVNGQWVTKYYKNTAIKNPTEEAFLQIVNRDPDIQLERTPIESTESVDNKVSTAYYEISPMISKHIFVNGQYVLRDPQITQDHSSVKHSAYEIDSKQKSPFTNEEWFTESYKEMHAKHPTDETIAPILNKDANTQTSVSQLQRALTESTKSDQKSTPNFSVPQTKSEYTYANGHYTPENTMVTDQEYLPEANKNINVRNEKGSTDSYEMYFDHTTKENQNILKYTKVSDRLKMVSNDFKNIPTETSNYGTGFKTFENGPSLNINEQVESITKGKHEQIPLIDYEEVVPTQSNGAHIVSSTQKQLFVGQQHLGMRNTIGHEDQYMPEVKQNYDFIPDHWVSDSYSPTYSEMNTENTIVQMPNREPVGSKKVSVIYPAVTEENIIIDNNSQKFTDHSNRKNEKSNQNIFNPEISLLRDQQGTKHTGGLSKHSLIYSQPTQLTYTQKYWRVTDGKHTLIGSRPTVTKQKSNVSGKATQTKHRKFNTNGDTYVPTYLTSSTQETPLDIYLGIPHAKYNTYDTQTDKYSVSTTQKSGQDGITDNIDRTYESTSSPIVKQAAVIRTTQHPTDHLQNVIDTYETTDVDWQTTATTQETEHDGNVDSTYVAYKSPMTPIDQQVSDTYTTRLLTDDTQNIGEDSYSGIIHTTYETDDTYFDQQQHVIVGDTHMLYKSPRPPIDQQVADTYTTRLLTDDTQNIGEDSYSGIAHTTYETDDTHVDQEQSTTLQEAGHNVIVGDTRMPYTSPNTQVADTYTTGLLINDTQNIGDDGYSEIAHTTYETVDTDVDQYKSSTLQEAGHNVIVGDTRMPYTSLNTQVADTHTTGLLINDTQNIGDDSYFGIAHTIHETDDTHDDQQKSTTLQEAGYDVIVGDTHMPYTSPNAQVPDTYTTGLLINDTQNIGDDGYSGIAHTTYETVDTDVDQQKSTTLQEAGHDVIVGDTHMPYTSLNTQVADTYTTGLLINDTQNIGDDSYSEIAHTTYETVDTDVDQQKSTTLQEAGHDVIVGDTHMPYTSPNAQVADTHTTGLLINDTQNIGDDSYSEIAHTTYETVDTDVDQYKSSTLQEAGHNVIVGDTRMPYTSLNAQVADTYTTGLLINDTQNIGDDSYSGIAHTTYETVDTDVDQQKSTTLQEAGHDVIVGDTHMPYTSLNTQVADTHTTGLLINDTQNIGDDSYFGIAHTIHETDDTHDDQQQSTTLQEAGYDVIVGDTHMPYTSPNAQVPDTHTTDLLTDDTQIIGDDGYSEIAHTTYETVDTDVDQYKSSTLQEAGHNVFVGDTYMPYETSRPHFYGYPLDSTLVSDVGLSHMQYMPVGAYVSSIHSNQYTSDAVENNLVGVTQAKYDLNYDDIARNRYVENTYVPDGTHTYTYSTGVTQDTSQNIITPSEHELTNTHLFPIDTAQKTAYSPHVDVMHDRYEPVSPYVQHYSGGENSGYSKHETDNTNSFEYIGLINAVHKSDGADYYSGDITGETAYDRKFEVPNSRHEANDVKHDPTFVTHESMHDTNTVVLNDKYKTIMGNNQYHTNFSPDVDHEMFTGYTNPRYETSDNDLLHHPTECQASIEGNIVKCVHTNAYDYVDDWPSESFAFNTAGYRFDDHPLFVSINHANTNIENVDDSNENIELYDAATPVSRTITKYDKAPFIGDNANSKENNYYKGEEHDDKLQKHAFDISKTKVHKHVHNNDDQYNLQKDKYIVGSFITTNAGSTELQPWESTVYTSDNSNSKGIYIDERKEQYLGEINKENALLNIYDSKDTQNEHYISSPKNYDSHDRETLVPTTIYSSDIIHKSQEIKDWTSYLDNTLIGSPLMMQKDTESAYELHGDSLNWYTDNYNTDRESTYITQKGEGYSPNAEYTHGELSPEEVIPLKRKGGVTSLSISQTQDDPIIFDPLDQRKYFTHSKLDNAFIINHYDPSTIETTPNIQQNELYKTINQDQRSFTTTFREFKPITEEIEGSRSNVVGSSYHSPHEKLIELYRNMHAIQDDEENHEHFPSKIDEKYTTYDTSLNKKSNNYPKQYSPDVYKDQSDSHVLPYHSTGYDMLEPKSGSTTREPQEEMRDSIKQNSYTSERVEADADYYRYLYRAYSNPSDATQDASSLVYEDTLKPEAQVASLIDIKPFNIITPYIESVNSLQDEIIKQNEKHKDYITSGMSTREQFTTQCDEIGSKSDDLAWKSSGKVVSVPNENINNKEQHTIHRNVKPTHHHTASYSEEEIPNYNIQDKYDALIKNVPLAGTSDQDYDEKTYPNNCITKSTQMSQSSDLILLPKEFVASRNIQNKYGDYDYDYKHDDHNIILEDRGSVTNFVTSYPSIRVDGISDREILLPTPNPIYPQVEITTFKTLKPILEANTKYNFEYEPHAQDIAMKTIVPRTNLNKVNMMYNTGYTLDYSMQSTSNSPTYQYVNNMLYDNYIKGFIDMKLNEYRKTMEEQNSKGCNHLQTTLVCDQCRSELTKLERTNKDSVFINRLREVTDQQRVTQPDLDSLIKDGVTEHPCDSYANAKLDIVKTVIDRLRDWVIGRPT